MAILRLLSVAVVLFCTGYASPALSEASKRWSGIDEAGADSLTYSPDSLMYREFYEQMQDTHSLTVDARRELEAGNYLAALSLARSAHSQTGVGVGKWRVIGLLVEYDKYWVMSNEGKKDRYILSNSIMKAREATKEEAFRVLFEAQALQLGSVLERARWLHTERGTLERHVELTILAWYEDLPEYMDWDQDYTHRYIDRFNSSYPEFDYGELGGRTKRIVKDIAFADGTLKISLRADPEEVAKISYSKGTVEFQYPRQTLEHLLRFIRSFWKQRTALVSAWALNPALYAGVNEVEFSLEFPNEDGTEGPILTCGLARSVAAGIQDWGKVKVKSGTFQTLMRERGSYWIHPQLPDL